jgi:hypothetical protein
MVITANNTRVALHPQPIYGYGYGGGVNNAGYEMEQLIHERETYQELFDLQLSDPLTDEYTIQTGIGDRYVQREFQHGMVLVDPCHARVLGIM